MRRKKKHKIIVFYIYIYISTQLCIQMKLDVMMDSIYINFHSNFFNIQNKEPIETFYYEALF